LNKRLIRVEEINKYNHSINKWYRGKRKLLTIITSPYNSSLIYRDLILSLLKEKKKILYIWDENEINKELVEELKNKIKFAYSFISKEEGNSEINFVNFKNIDKISNAYDLCIIDDISIFSKLRKIDIRDTLERVYFYCKKISIYSIEKIINSGESIYISDLRRNSPFVEPRIMHTKVNLEEEIPYNLYDYMMWFKENHNKTIIFMPIEDNVNKIYENYTELLKAKDTKIIKYIKNDNMKKIESLYNEKNKCAFIITNSIKSYAARDFNINIVVLMADNSYINYKKIIFLCADAGKSSNRNLGEVILISKTLSDDMELAKKITRGYNKEIWEKGLLKY
jgi:late competence protein required for DNA uptake (superfamily II DNA/RNA helicase)